jgi:hypothetical protein
MKKLFVLALVVVALSGCDNNPYDQRRNTLCMDGVEYWVFYHHAKPSSLAVRISPETLKPVLCSVKNLDE